MSELKPFPRSSHGSAPFGVQKASICHSQYLHPFTRSFNHGVSTAPFILGISTTMFERSTGRDHTNRTTCQATKHCGTRRLQTSNLAAEKRVGLHIKVLLFRATGPALGIPVANAVSSDLAFGTSRNLPGICPWQKAWAFARINKPKQSKLANWAKWGARAPEQTQAAQKHPTSKNLWRGRAPLFVKLSMLLKPSMDHLLM